MSTTAAPSQPAVPSWVRRRAAWRARIAFVVAAAVIVGAAALTVVVAAPPLAGGWQAAPALGLAGVLLGGLAGAAWALRTAYQVDASRRFFLLSGGVALLLLAGLAVGATSQVVIDGRAYLRTSETAQVYAAATRAYDDITWMVAASELLTVDEADARVRLSEFAPTALQMRELAADHLALERAGGPTGDMVLLHRTVKEAATVGAQAIEQREQLIRSPNPQLIADLQASSGQMFESILRAGGMLDDLAVRYGFRLGPTELADPVE